MIIFLIIFFFNVFKLPHLCTQLIAPEWILFHTYFLTIVVLSFVVF